MTQPLQALRTLAKITHAFGMEEQATKFGVAAQAELRRLREIEDRAASSTDGWVSTRRPVQESE